MNKQQQKLYDKLLKKVNEYCLGAAAEDVIAAIDALVENYERYLHSNKNHLSIVKLIVKPTLEDALKTIYNSQDIMGGYDDFWEAYRMIETAVKALEIIKKQINSLDIYKGNFYFNGERISKEEYELLKEILK